MSLDFEYGINTGNRFLGFVGHDEDPEEFIARQTQPEEKPKKSSKDVKSATSTATKKKTTTTTTTAATVSASSVSGNTTRTNKENLTGKSSNTDQRRQPQSNVLSDNNNQQTRAESGRGGSRGFSRRGGSAGQDRPPYEGGSRGGGQQRTQRFNKFEGQQTSTETSGFEQTGEGWENDTGNDNQQFGSYRGRGRGQGRGNYEGGRGRGNYEGGRGRGNYEGGRGRGNYEGGRGNYEGGRGNYEGGRGNYEGGRGNYEGGRGNYEGGRGNYEGGRGRGRGGRGNFNNRNFEEGSQQQQTQETGGWQQSTESNFEKVTPQSAQPADQEFNVDVSTQERPFEPANRRGGRGQFRSRTFHNNRNYGSDRSNQNEREGDQDDSRYRRQHDRQPRSNVSGVKPIEKKDGEGAHNWGSQTENPDDIPVVDETADATDQPASASKAGWAEQVDEAEKQMTLDEYKKQIEAKKRAQQEKVPQFNRRVAGEGEDPKSFKPFAQEYRKKNEGEESDEGDVEEGSGSEANESDEENEEEQYSGKKKIITIPLHFKPIEIPRGGPAGSRGGPRRGGRFRDRDRPNRDDHPRSKSPSQQQPPFYQQTGEYQNEEQQSRPYRGGPGRGSGRGEYRRASGNSARGSRGGYNRSMGDPNTPDFDNTVDFPTLPKQ